MGGSSSPNGCRRLLSEINVTPLVDVMLVLLIIFMVTAPMMTKGIAVNLPETTAKALPQKQDYTEVVVTAKGGIFLNSISIDEHGLAEKLREINARNKISQVLLRADETVPYGKVATVMAAIREAGINNLGLVTAPESVKKPSRPLKK